MKSKYPAHTDVRRPALKTGCFLAGERLSLHTFFDANKESMNKTYEEVF